MHLRNLCRILALVCLVTPAAFPQTLMYNFVHLGFSGGGSQVSINRWGDVVGTNNTTNTAFLYSRGVLSTLWSGPGFGTAINDNLLTTLYQTSHAFTYVPGAAQPTPLGTLGGFMSYPYAINNSGTVVGQSVSSTDGQYHPFVFSNGQMSDLGTLGGGSPQCSATAINSSGGIVGACVNAAGYWRAFRVAAGLAGDLDPRSTTYDSAAYAINDSGDAAGYSDKGLCSLQTGVCRGTTTYPVIFSNAGTITKIGGGGGTYGVAEGMNNLGDVVGLAKTSAGLQHAFLFSHATMNDLNSATVVNGSGWTFTDAKAINDSGQIVGHGINPSTQQFEIVILTPVPVILASLTINPSTIPGGNSTTATVTLSRPAPLGGVVIQLADNNPAAQFPNGNTLTIAPGVSSATFPISTSLVLTQTTVSISASFNGITRNSFLILTPDHGS